MRTQRFVSMANRLRLTVSAAVAARRRASQKGPMGRPGTEVLSREAAYG
jgi:hypothetical protein